MQNIKALYIIVNAGFSESAIEIARNCGATGGTVFSARGTGHHKKEHKSLFHFEPEKEIIICLVTEEVANKVMDVIKEVAGVDSPVNGICFMLPVDKMTSLNKQDIE